MQLLIFHINIIIIIGENFTNETKRLNFLSTCYFYKIDTGAKHYIVIKKKPKKRNVHQKQDNLKLGKVV